MIEHKSKKLKKYLSWELCNFSKYNIFAVVNIKNGFSNSIGCNLKKYRLSQRLAPFTSIPIIGTNAKKIKEITNSGIIIFFSNEVSIIERVNIIDKAKIVKLKCFEKKKIIIFI